MARLIKWAAEYISIAISPFVTPLPPFVFELLDSLDDCNFSAADARFHCM